MGIRLFHIITFFLFICVLTFTSCGGGGGSENRDEGGVDCNVPSLGLTKEEAEQDIVNQTIQRGLSPKEAYIGVDAIERLTPLGVTVDSAYQLIIACFDHNIRAKEIAPIVRALELAIPTTGPEVTDIATTAIRNNYTPDDVTDIIAALETGTKAGAGSDIPEEIACIGINRGVDGYRIVNAVDVFTEGINEGLSPEEAKDNALASL